MFALLFHFFVICLEIITSYNIILVILINNIIVNHNHVYNFTYLKGSNNSKI